MRGHLQHRGGDAWRIKVTWADPLMPQAIPGRTVRGTRRDVERELSRLVVEVDEGRTPRRRR